MKSNFIILLVIFVFARAREGGLTASRNRTYADRIFAPVCVREGFKIAVLQSANRSADVGTCE